MDLSSKILDYILGLVEYSRDRYYVSKQSKQSIKSCHVKIMRRNGFLEEEESFVNKTYTTKFLSGAEKPQATQNMLHYKRIYGVFYEKEFIIFINLTNIELIKLVFD